MKIAKNGCAKHGDCELEVVHHCATTGWAGGKVHDAVHLRCAQKAGCDRIYTFNVKDFRALAPSGLQDKIGPP